MKKTRKVWIPTSSQMIHELNLIPKESLRYPDLKKEVRCLSTDRGFKSNYLIKQ